MKTLGIVIPHVMTDKEIENLADFLVKVAQENDKNENGGKTK